MKSLTELVTDAVSDREARIRQGKVISVTAGPPRTLTVDISGVSYPSIRCMDHVVPVVGEGVWMLDMGIGRWLCFGTSSTSSPVKRPGVYLTSASQAVAAAATVSLSWTTEVSDIDGWITVTGTTLTVPTGWSGVYLVTARTSWSASTTSPIEIVVSLNGSVFLNAAGAMAFGVRTVSGVMRGLVAGDTIVVQVYNGSAGALNVTGALQIEWLGR